MGCRIGMTTDPKRRYWKWKSEYPSLINWTILATDLSRDEAQVMETRIAYERGCESSPGGDDPDDPFATWSVYYFEYL